MKRFILAAAAVSALAMLQTPAHAQYPYNPNLYNPNPYPQQGPYNPNPYPQRSDDYEHHDYDYDHQHYDRHDQDEGNPWDIDQRITWLEDRIARGQESGELDRDAAYHAQQEIQAIRRDDERYRDHNRGRLSDYEREHLIDRLEAIGHELRWREDYREPWEDR
jgi:hypothetical protein